MAGEFGKYRLLRRLAVGGMAEVFLAEVRGEGGFRKFVAIKRILPHLSAEKEFISMFFDEARLMARFAHPNIVQIYDLGRVKNTYFLAMEFVKGLTMFRVVNRCAKLRQRIPLHITARIVSDTCSALDYAHSFTSPDGSPLEIVHRDVSAQNIMLSTDGVVKVLDFGVAKAVGNLSRTRPSWLKGKALYMSPEQIEMRPIDRRSDIFSLGTLLYIMTTMHRPFRGESEYQVMMSIVNQSAPDPRQYNPELPEEMVRIIGRALEKDVGARYQTAQQMRDDLEHFLFERRQRVEAVELSQFLQSLLPARKKKTTGVKRVPTRPIPAPLNNVPSLDLGESELDEVSADQPILLLPKTMAEPVLLDRPKTPIREVPGQQDAATPQADRGPVSTPQATPPQPAVPADAPRESDIPGPVPGMTLAEDEAPFAALTRPRRTQLWIAVLLFGLTVVALVVWQAWPDGGASAPATVDTGAAPAAGPAGSVSEPVREGADGAAGGGPAAASPRDTAEAPAVADAGGLKTASGKPARRPRRRTRPRRRSPTTSWRSIEPVVETVPEQPVQPLAGGGKDGTGDGAGDSEQITEKAQPPVAKPSGPAGSQAEAATSDSAPPAPTAPTSAPKLPPVEEVAGQAGSAQTEPPARPRPDTASTADSGTVSKPAPSLAATTKSTTAAPVDIKPIYMSAARVKARRLSGREPEYPRMARRARLQANLVVKIYISPQGTVEQVRFLKTHEAFEAAVRDAVKSWRFSPHLVNGRPVPTYTVYKFVFRLD